MLYPNSQLAGLVVNGFLISDNIQLKTDDLKNIKLQNSLYLGSLNMMSVQISQVEVTRGISYPDLTSSTEQPCNLTQGDLMSWNDMSWREPVKS